MRPVWTRLTKHESWITMEKWWAAGENALQPFAFFSRLFRASFIIFTNPIFKILYKVTFKPFPETLWFAILEMKLLLKPKQMALIFGGAVWKECPIRHYKRFSSKFLSCTHVFLNVFYIFSLKWVPISPPVRDFRSKILSEKPSPAFLKMWSPSLTEVLTYWKANRLIPPSQKVSSKRFQR